MKFLKVLLLIAVAGFIGCSKPGKPTSADEHDAGTMIGGTKGAQDDGKHAGGVSQLDASKFD